jgi:hypothetical protein|tara:strand:+ start:92 stop:280 length:189 start_codon:yes stop_codon:yes gene_type:complete
MDSPEHRYTFPPPYYKVINTWGNVMIPIAWQIIPIMEEFNGDEFELTDGEIIVTIAKINKRT